MLSFTRRTLDGAGSGGLFTPYLKRYYPQLMNAAFAENDRKRFGGALFPEGSDEIAKLLQLAEQPAMAPDGLSMLTVGSGRPFPGQGRFQLEKYLRERGDANVR